jgi:mannose-1-phosphate guanylyltransferase
MCGGAGTRLWPASREDRPKQFLPLFGPYSTFQDTIRRVSDPAHGKAAQGQSALITSNRRPSDVISTAGTAEPMPNGIAGASHAAASLMPRH